MVYLGSWMLADLLWGVRPLIPPHSYILGLQELTESKSAKEMGRLRRLAVTAVQQGIDLVELVLPLISHLPTSNNVQLRSPRPLLVSTAHVPPCKQAVQHVLHQLETCRPGRSKSSISSACPPTESRRTRLPFNRQWVVLTLLSQM